MSTAKNGDTVKLHYTGTLTDGSVFDTSRNEDPFEVTIGGNQVISKFEEAIVGMEEGESKTFSIPSQEAYGPTRDDLIIEVAKSELPPELDPQVGMMLQVPTNQGPPANVMVADVTDDAIVLDGNHPLAGKDLTFEVELVSIV